MLQAIMMKDIAVKLLVPVYAIGVLVAIICRGRCTEAMVDVCFPSPGYIDWQVTKFLQSGTLILTALPLAGFMIHHYVCVIRASVFILQVLLFALENACLVAASVVIPGLTPLVVGISHPRIKHCPLSPLNGPKYIVGTGRSAKASQADNQPKVGRKRQKGQDDDGDSGTTGPPPKQGRGTKYHPRCFPCALWSQSGSDPALAHYHPQANYMRHPGNESEAFSNYATHENTQIHLKPDSCICDSCYKDFTRNYTNRENTIPRWAKKRDEYYVALNRVATQHCIFCCGSLTQESECQCQHITQWGPEQWHGLDDILSWKRFLMLSGTVDHIISNTANHVCRVHYRRIWDIRNKRKCVVCCNPFNDSWWKLVCEITNNLKPIAEAFSVPIDAISMHSWVCKGCRLCFTDVITFCTSLERDQNSPDLITAKRAKIIADGITTLKKDGILFTAEILSEFKNYLIQLGRTDLTQPANAFMHYLDTALRKCKYASYCPAKKAGRLYFNEIIFNPKSIPYVCQLYIDKLKLEERCKNLESSSLNTDKLKSMIAEQASVFPSTRSFDYRCLIGTEKTFSESSFDNHFNKDLLDLIDTITTSEHSQYRTVSPLYKDTRRMRVKMCIAILCMAMNPHAIFLQTLVGLHCYTYGLRDAGFEILNAIGCTCSIDHVRQHGYYWANQRQAVDELNPLSFWRLSIDNLNFKIKFAKNLSTGSTPGLKKMLNLITGQVTTQTSPMPQPAHASQTLTSLVASSLTAHVVHDCQPTSVSETDYILDCASDADFMFEMFQKACFASTVNRLACLPVQCSESLVTSFQKYMPHWTPPEPDNIVYATVEEAMSATIGDVEMYLVKLKEDLQICKEGFPNRVLIGGDQQTFAIMKNLQKRYPGRFDWIHVIHGDWHLLKLYSELLRDLLWDGGLKEFANDCGYKKELFAWQEIHLMLVATYEAMMRKACEQFTTHVNANSPTILPLNTYGSAFWDWIKQLSMEANKDHISRFWAKSLFHLHTYVGYYFSIRSGNWQLRNSCLKVISPLFFAYSRDKYIDVSTTAIFDSLTFPGDIRRNLMNGQWTVSLKGKPYHNIAIDEAHECVINLRLKEITSRPSHFRTVELADFMAYLDRVIEGFENYIFRNRAQPSDSQRRFVCQRSTRISKLIQPVALFQNSNTERQLCNIFSSKPCTLDSITIHDLLNFPQVGMERMLTYVRQHTLVPPTEPPQRKRRPLKLRTFSRQPTSSRAQTTTVKQLTNIIKNTMTILQSSGITAQASPFPLAIANLHGNMRTCNKSTFREALCSHSDFRRAFTNICTIISNPPTDLCIIIDFLYYLHMPPPPDVYTFAQFFEHLWHLMVAKNLNARYIYIVIDKPEYLPPPRTLVHESRAKRAKQLPGPDPTVSDESPIPHSQTYISFLTSTSFKTKLIAYLSQKMVERAIPDTSTKQLCIVIDTPSFLVPTFIMNGSSRGYHPNQHGEADYALWHHAIHTQSTNILIISSDTDTWVYGLGIMELGWLRDKTVFVQRGNLKSFVDISLACTLIRAHPILQQLTHPATSLVALYALTGCDYVSSFFGTTKKRFLDTLMQNVHHICDLPEGLVKFEDGVLQGIDATAWMKLVCAAYYSKHKTFFRNRPVGIVYNSMIQFPGAPENQRLLSWLGYPPGHRLDSLQDWHRFLQKVTFHASSVTQYLEAKVLPSWEALNYHCLRATYVLKLAFSAPQTSCSSLMEFDNYGWTMSGSNSIEIEWGTSHVTSTSPTCGCSSGCNTNRCRCFRNNQACSARCKCKECNNEYNQYTAIENQPTSDNDSSDEDDDEEQVENTAPQDSAYPSDNEDLL